ncbi:M20/M25/M40 family metallo-hydrolase [Sphingomonas psychrotolerans]|uniref:M20/M25/M40 family metallo-hydrolase n=1 Tax=Sphingomonas psychrotolerans TaxID=1327635 RepID=A0ABU3N933_9SPHN|nr:M20/M25/M40 family metallo-hydrolase [Sphingomonas psychrotolerans]MDT8759875.1 M20/M25/M40 family metallo-hydrolase [Sphingomonas psychrotolerans]
MRVPMLLAGLLLATTPLAAQPARDEPQFSAAEVRKHVTFLADDRLEGRDAGTPGHEAAARYVAMQFAGLGLEPGGPDKSWFQQVSLAEYGLDARHPASLHIGARSFANGTDVLIAPSPRFGTGAQIVAGETVFVGYGLEASDLGYDDYAGLDLRGKFAVMLLGTPKGLPAPVAARMNKDRGVIAAKHGAIGILYIVAPDEERQWRYASDTLLGDTTKWLSPEGFPEGLDPGVRIGAYLDEAAAKALFAGSGTRVAQLFAAAAVPKAKIKGFALKQRATLTRTSKVKAYRSPNVIGVLRGSDPALADQYVVLSAHLDHVGVDPHLPGDKIHNGAMDNAAGVATMLEAARAFAQSKDRPKRSILFVALTAEEDGLLGSSYLAQHPVTGSGRLVADVNLDMPILLYDFQDVIAFGGEHSTMGEIVARAGAWMGVSVSPDPMPEEQFFVRSDHYNFVKAGVPSIFLMTGFANGGEKAFRDFLANNYHQPSDQLDLPFNWEAGAKFARLNYWIAREVADAPEPPHWYQGDEFGDRFAPGQSRAPRRQPGNSASSLVLHNSNTTSRP